MSNLRGAPLFLRPSVVRALTRDVATIVKGIALLEVLPTKLVDHCPAPSKPEITRIDSSHGEAGNDDAAELEGWPDAPLPEHADPDLDRPEPEPTYSSARVIAKPVGEAVQVRCHKGKTPPAFVIERAAAKFAAITQERVCSRPPVKESGLDGMAARESASQTQMAKPAPLRNTAGDTRSPNGFDLMRSRSSAAPRSFAASTFEQRRQRLDAAIAFLKRQCILVSVVDRDSPVRRYRVSGKRENQMAEDVVEYAIELGLELAA